MKKLLFILSFFVAFTGFSQSISKQVIAPSGASYENGNNKLSYTAGEVVVGAMTAEDSSIQLGNGYYPSLDLSVLNTETLELVLHVKIFPNPVTEFLFITHPTELYYDVMITDVSGKQIINTSYKKQEPLSVETLTTGTYFITVTTKDSKQTNTYKIIKR